MKVKRLKQFMFVSKQMFYIFLLQLTTLQLVSASQSRSQSIERVKISIRLENAGLEKIFSAIEERTDFVFIYDSGILQDDRKNSLDCKNEPLVEILKRVATDHALNFRQINNTIFVKGVKAIPDIPGQNNSRQPVRSVSGKVTDREGKALTGVSVSIKGTIIGTVTDIDGSFQINLKENDHTLIFSFIGMKTREVDVLGRGSIEVTMEEETIGLDEVVAIGYGILAKRDVTGAMSTIEDSRLKDFQAASFSEALAGIAPGLQVSQTTGVPGTSPSIRIRGVGSITAGNEPLYVIDGFPLDHEALSSFNMDDIESITILKDASATSIYGSRGANGVILISTKKGKTGAAKISFVAYTGIQKVTKKVDVLSPDEFVEFATDAVNNAWAYLGNDINDPMDSRPPFYQVPPFYYDKDNWVSTDWQDEIFHLAPIQNYTLSVSGGTESVRYKLSGGYFDQDGIILNSDFKRYSLGANFDVDLTSRLRLSVGINASKADNRKVNDTGQWGGGIVGTAVSLPGFFATANEDGSYPSFQGMGFSVSAVPNPMVFINEYSDQEKQVRILGNATVEYDIVKGLYFKSLLGFDNYDEKNNSFHKSYDTDVPFLSYYKRTTTQASGSYSTVASFNWLSENTFHYHVKWNDRHNINVLLGMTAQKVVRESSSIEATNFPDNFVPTLNAGQISGASTSKSEWSMLSYLARANYGFKDKYFMTLTLRRDGSSRFGNNRKWGYFPSASVGWLMSEETFMQNLSLINYLKIRASYGISGNNAIPDYGSVGLLSYSDYVIGNDIVSGIVPYTLSNANLSWETSKQVNVGIDLGLFDNRIKLNADIYQTTNDNLLLDVPVPSILGVTESLQNIGKVRNRGLELSLTTQNLTGKFNWTTDFNISFNRNKVLALGNAGDPIRSSSNQESNITRIGRPIGDFYGYVFEGVYNTMDEINSRPHLSTDRPGDPIVKDVNKDEKISVDDRTILGNYQPDFFYGMQNTFRYKNFDLNIFLQGVYGAEIMNLGMRQTLSMNGRTNNLGIARDRWRSPEEPGNGKVFNASIDIRGVRRNPSTFFMEDGSFLRIRNITIGYNFKSSVIEKMRITNARVYLSSQNPFTFTKYSGYNPEVSSYHNSLTPGVDYFNYPLAKNIVFGINFTL